MEQFKTILLTLDNYTHYIIWIILSIFILRTWFRLPLFLRWKTYNIDFTLTMLFVAQFIIRVVESIAGVEVAGFAIVLSAFNVILWVAVYRYEKFTYLKEQYESKDEETIE